MLRWLSLSLLLLLSSSSLAQEVCVNPEMAAHVRNLLLDSLDQAIKDRISALFEVWMRDDSEQPKRAIQGLNNTLKAYVRVRSNALKWNPTQCVGPPDTMPKYEPPK